GRFATATSSGFNHQPFSKIRLGGNPPSFLSSAKALSSMGGHNNGAWQRANGGSMTKSGYRPDVQMSALILASPLAVAAPLPAAAQEVHAFDVTDRGPAGAVT